MPAVIGHDWYARNALRKYPLHDAATGEPDGGGRRLPDGLLADLSLEVPRALGRYAYLGAASAGPEGVSVVFLACRAPDEAAPDYAPVAGLSLAAPVRPGRAYALEALAEGAGGTVVFGPGWREPFVGRFRTPAQALVAPRAVRSRPAAAAVLGLGKEGVAGLLAGEVRLAAGRDVVVEAATREVAGRARRVAVLRLDGRADPAVWTRYAGPCGGRPESGTCDRPALEGVNTVRPDCDGNVRLEFRGGVEAAAAPGGLVLDYPYGLADACTSQDRLPDASGRLPGEHDDQCTTPYEGTPAPPPGVPRPPAPPIEISVSSSTYECGDLPHDADLAAGGDFETPWGVWGPEAGDGPGSGLYSSEGLVGSSAGRPEVFYTAADPAGRNLALWNRCAYASSLEKRVVAEFRPAAGPARNGAVLLNYHFVGGVEQYYLAELDLVNATFRVAFWNGSAYQTLARSGALAEVPGAWYRVEAWARPAGGGLVTLAARLRGATGPGLDVYLEAAARAYAPDDGLFGIGTDRSRTDFRRFRVEAL